MVRNYRQLARETERLATLSDVDEVLNALSRLLRKTVKSRWAVVYLLDRERQSFTPARSCGLPSRYHGLFREMPLLPGKIPLLRNMLRRRKFLVLSDAGSSELLNPLLRKLLRRLTLLAVPMVVRNQVLGAVFVARAASLPPFSDDEIALIRDMVTHAAVVISHIRIFDGSLDMAVEMAKRIDVILTLDEINKAISSSLSPERIIRTAMERIERIVSCELVAVLVAQGGDLEVMAVHSSSVTPPPELAAGTRIRDRGLASQAFVQRESRYLPDLGETRRASRLDRAIAAQGIRSLMAIPLLSKEKSIGVLLLGDTQEGQFQLEDAFTVEKIAAQMAVALENARLFEQTRALFINTVASLANAIDAKSPWTKGHSERVMRLAATIADELGLDERQVEDVRLGGLLHDIGKIGIIEALLEKPATLSEEEFPPMRLHPEKGVAILSPIEQLQDVLPGILHHHENYDGSGYPAGLKGEEIPLAARIIAVADSFDAMISERPYKQAMPPFQALVELQACAGIQFDPTVVEAFRRHLERHIPVPPEKKRLPVVVKPCGWPERRAGTGVA